MSVAGLLDSPDCAFLLKTVNHRLNSCVGGAVLWWQSFLDFSD